MSEKAKSVRSVPTIYENILIGNFLFGLGLAIGMRRPGGPLQMAVNLLQQTPGDRKLGDLMLGGPRLVRVIEFKRFTNDSKKETAKHLSLVRSLQDAGYRHLEPVSRKIHLYVEMEEKRDDPRTYTRPYLDFLSTRVGSPMHQLVDELAVTALGPPMDDQTRARCHEYLTMLQRAQGAAWAGSGALLVAVNDKMQIEYAVLEDLRDLRLTAHQALDRYEGLVRVADAHEAQQLRQAQAHVQERSIGMDYSR